MSFDWNDKAVAKLQRLAARGLSGSEIAAFFDGAVSRSAVIAKIGGLRAAGHDIGLKPRNGGGMRKPEPKRRNGEQFSRPQRRKDVALKAMPSAPPALRASEPDPVRDADGKHLTMLTVSGRQCRWPHGEPKHPDFHLCGRAAQGPYCEFHRARAGALYARRSA